MQGPASTGELRTVRDIAERHLPAPAIPECVGNLLAEMAEAENHAADPMAFEQLDLMLGERAARDVQKNLRDAIGQRVQARGHPPGQYGDRQTHENSTLVPSKSKRK